MPVLYHGNGEFLNGIPARDLSDEEFSALDAETRERVRASALYDSRQAPPESVQAEAPKPRRNPAPTE
jgi:hypothetical protein